MHTPQAVVSRMKADGAICVKTFFERGFGGVRDLPVPKLETIREVVKVAHAAGLASCGTLIQTGVTESASLRAFISRPLDFGIDLRSIPQERYSSAGSGQ